MCPADQSAAAARELAPMDLGSNRVAPRPPALAVRASKLRPITTRVGVVRRSVLLDRMTGSDAPIVRVVGPAGYGKTSLLTQGS